MAQTATLRDFQRALNSKGYAKPLLDDDGIMGPKTLAAIKLFQEKNGLVVDGIIGPKTASVLGLVLAPIKPSSIVSEIAPPGVIDISPLVRYDNGRKMGAIKGFIWHHTAGGGTAFGVVSTLNQRGLGVHYIMDTAGQMYLSMPLDHMAAHILPSNAPTGSPLVGLHNGNSWGCEVIGANDAAINAVQVESAKRFASQLGRYYPNIVYGGHGEVNIGRKQPTEGLTITKAVRDPRSFKLAGDLVR